MSDTRTYPHSADSDAEQAPACVPYAEFAFYAAKVARLTHDLADAQTVANLQRDLHAAKLATANDNATELGKALDMCIAERDQAFAELNAERNAHNATAAQLYAKLDAQAKRHAEIIDQWKAEENMWRYYDKKQLAQIAALRAELDAMRQAHSVIVGRMAAMGC